MVFYTGLARVARNAGLVVRETANWKGRTLTSPSHRRNGMIEGRGVLWHHTATAASAVKARNNPTLQHLINGLGYPSANLLLAWDGSMDIVGAGATAHAGKGSYNRIPTNQGNDYLIGVEVEGTTGLNWSNDQLEAAARFGHAMSREFGSNFLHIGHLEYAPGRKVDPSGIPGGMSALRKAIGRGYWKDKNWKPGGAVKESSSPSTTPRQSPSTPSNASSNYEVRKVKRNNAVVYANRGANKRAVGQPSKGYGLNVVKDEGSWTQVRWKYDGKYQNAWIAKSSLEKSKAWPNKKLKVTSSHTQASHDAWVKLMADVGYTDASLTTAIQKWLRDLGYYKGTIDTNFGPRTVRALQNFLKDKGLYKGVIDNKRQKLTIQGEIKYLNQQRKYYG